jgi:deoxyhypusine synthase
MASNDPNAPPSGATDAVLVVSEEMPEGAQKVEELDFDDFRGPLTVADMYERTKYMGFQASAVGEAVRIINEMVR